jgi:hypothetical protein
MSDVGAIYGLDWKRRCLLRRTRISFLGTFVFLKFPRGPSHLAKPSFLSLAGSGMVFRVLRPLRVSRFGIWPFRRLTVWRLCCLTIESEERETWTAGSLRGASFSFGEAAPDEILWRSRYLSTSIWSGLPSGRRDLFGCAWGLVKRVAP